ncbi:Cysteine/O-acetylserine efflux protein [Hartmannibacter diazotrophicus]|uniref:Cysteine/O-acetylserine efflux protein n=1 Tax=Hartmannibacter diazotrophicus TaxID=1482074 RepID=A0A2C9DDG4_9HYPH|nr:LysE family translocator [Hartmannibacter diazotrophicus]SON58210.1 Cysteine/O-acetylserine efflux protein [Hartmannibacter diazotrophicus]
METLIGFVTAALALTGSPGPNTLSLAAAGAAFGARASMPYFWGLLAGMLAVMAIVGTGVTGILLAVPSAAAVLTIAAGVYFLWLAWKIATAPPLDDAGARRRLPRFRDGAFLSLVNPKAYAAMASLFSGFQLLQDSPAADGLAKTGLLLADIAIVNVVWLQAGAMLTRYFREPKASRAINIGFAILLILSVGLAVLR